jgi:hypothetical protein
MKNIKGRHVSSMKDIIFLLFAWFKKNKFLHYITVSDLLHYDLYTTLFYVSLHRETLTSE